VLDSIGSGAYPPRPEKKTFKFTVPDLPLTKNETVGRKKKNKLDHSDYIQSFGVFLLVVSFFGYLPLSVIQILTEGSFSSTTAAFILLVLSYLSFYWATRNLLVNRLKAEQDSDGSAGKPPGVER